MSDDSPSVIRKPSSAEELAKLHPVERVLVRLFEFLSSIKLAIALMVWLMIECIVGTVLESQVNVSAARYFVYGNIRFAILLALLGLNITCAALIRFPWKRHQTGFVVTHVGLLMLLFSAVLTMRDHLDALMVVGQGEAEDQYVDANDERIQVDYFDAKGHHPQAPIPVNFGPFSWGHKLWGSSIAWRKGRQESFALENGDTLTVKKFLANCEAIPTYVPSEAGLRGAPAVEFRLRPPNAQDAESQWLAVDERRDSATTTEPLPEMGIIYDFTLRRLDPEALERFEKNASNEGPALSKGVLYYLSGRARQRFAVADLLKRPVPIEGTDRTIFVKEFLANAQPAKTGERRLVSDGDEPKNPALAIEITDAGKPTSYYCFADPSLNELLVKSQGTEHIFIYFTRPLDVQMAVTPDKELAYRVYGPSGLSANGRLKAGDAFPVGQGLSFVMEKAIPKARPDHRLIPRPLRRGEEGVRGAIVEMHTKEGDFETALYRQPNLVSGGEPSTIHLQDKAIRLKFTHFEGRTPFKIRLDQFDQPSNPGTNDPAAFTSNVTLIDEDQHLEEKRVITMNQPLIHTGSDGRGYTFYQTSINRVPTTQPDGSTKMIPVSTYTVARDPGLRLKEAGTVVLSVGIFLMFYMGNYFKKSKRPAKPTPAGSVVARACETPAAAGQSS